MNTVQFRLLKHPGVKSHSSIAVCYFNMARIRWHDVGGSITLLVSVVKDYVFFYSYKHSHFLYYPKHGTTVLFIAFFCLVFFSFLFFCLIFFFNGRLANTQSQMVKYRLSLYPESNFPGLQLRRKFLPSYFSGKFRLTSCLGLLPCV